MIISLAVSLRFPGEGHSAQGESAPKARPKGVVDGKQVNIPAPPFWRLHRGVTVRGRASGNQIPVPGEGRWIGKSVHVISDPGGPARGTACKWIREKPRSEAEVVTVPKLTQVGGLNIPRRSREPSLRNSAN